MDYDPFNETTNDEESTTVFDAPPAEAPAPKKAAPKKAVAKADNDEGKIVLTFKEGAGFDASWTVVHANNVEEAKGILLDREFKELLDLQKKAASYFRGGETKSSGGGGNGAPRGAQEPPAGTPAAPGPDWTFKTGVGKNGKTWKAWMPPRDSDEKPVWL